MQKINSYRFIGVDTHKNQHTAVVINCFNQCLGIIETPNNPACFDNFIKQIKVHTNSHQLAFGLEDTGGLGRSLSQFLTLKNFIVKEVNPIQTERKRNRKVHPEKNDPQDALAIAKTLLSEFDNLPDASHNDLYTAIRDLSGYREFLVKEQTRLKNKFHALIKEQYPMYESIFKNPFSKSAIAFWIRFPSPLDLANIGIQRLSSFLQKHSNKTMSNKKAEEILKITKPFVSLSSSILLETRASVVKKIVSQITNIQKELNEIETQLSTLIEKTDYKINSLTGVNTATSAKIISSIGDINRFKNANKLAKFAGIAPLDKSSGKKQKHKKSNRGHRKLNSAIYHIALCQIGSNRSDKPKNLLGLTYYQKKLSEGKTKKEALTCLMRRLCDIIFRMMKNKTKYILPAIAC